jgi:hypothetical protein
LVGGIIVNNIDLKLYDFKKGWITLSVIERNEHTKSLLERVKDILTNIHDGSDFEINEVSDRYIRFSYYSPATGQVGEMEVGITADGKHYDGSYGIYEKYTNSLDGVTFEGSEVWKQLIESYERNPSFFNYLVTVFYYDMTEKAAFEHWHVISIEGDDYEFFTADPSSVMPSTKEQMQARCLTLKRAIETGKEDEIIGERIYWSDTHHKEEIDTLRDEDLPHLRKMLALAIKEAVNGRLDEI